MGYRTKPKGLPRLQCTPTKRKAIVIYHDCCGMSFSAIANEAPEFKSTACDHRSIARNYHKAKDLGMYWKPYRPGRPHAVDQQKLVEEGIPGLDGGKFTDSEDLRRQLFPTARPRTIRKNLRKLGLLGFVRRRKVTLTPEHFLKRYQWAKKHRHWCNPRTWNSDRVVFSDESKFVIGGSDGRRWCRRRRGVDVFNEQNVSQRERRGLGIASVFVWGSMTRDGPGNLVRINETMDRWVYIDILKVRWLYFCSLAPPDMDHFTGQSL